MNIKELDLLSRGIITLVLSFTFAFPDLQFVNWKILLGTAVPLVLISFVFQYIVLHRILQNTASARHRTHFLLGWMLVASGICLVANMKTVSITEMVAAMAGDKMLHAYPLDWPLAFMISGGAFIASWCALRVFARRGALK